MSKPLLTDRLYKLADFLETVQPKHFNLGSYVDSRNAAEGDESDGYSYNELSKDDVKALCAVGKGKDAELKCGTTACAMGWAPAVYPRIFRWDIKDGLVCTKNENLEEGAQEFFGISEDEYTYLFMPGSYKKDDKTKPKDVAKRIRAFADAKTFLSNIAKDSGLTDKYEIEKLEEVLGLDRLDRESW